MTPPIFARILIADDDANIREALRELLECEDGLAVVGVAEDAVQAVELAARERPDVAILDVKMPGGGGPMQPAASARRAL